MDVPWKRLYHQLNLQLYGVFVPGMDDYHDSQGVRMFREFRLQFSYPNEAGDPVSMKLPVRPATLTPYVYQNEKVFFQGEELSFPDTKIYRVPVPPEEDPWHLKGYTFPFRGSRNPNCELRLNLKITGHCPGRCFFCHRTHSHRIRVTPKHTPEPAVLLTQIKSSEGEDIFAKISQIMVISELFGNEKRFLDAVQQTSEALFQAGFPAERDFNCCASDVRSLDGLKRLREIVRPRRYSFSLEFFQNREQWMGPYKGIPLKQVCEVLENARKAGFEEIQLNYMAGIDSPEAYREGFSDLARLGLVDSIGLSTFTMFAEDEMPMRSDLAWQAEYYQNLVSILNEHHIKAYRPDSYDIVCPYTTLMEKIR